MIAIVFALLGAAPLIPLAWIATWLSLGRAWSGNRHPRRGEGQLIVDPDKLTFSPTVEVARSRVTAATWRDDTLLGPLVEVAVRRRPGLLFAMESDDDARLVIEALGFGVVGPGEGSDAPRPVARRTATFFGESRMPLAARTAVVMTASVLLFVAMVHLVERPMSSLVLPAAAGALFMLAAWLATHPTRIEVGVDGVALSWLGLQRFVDFAEIIEVRPFGDDSSLTGPMGVVIVLRSGASRKIELRKDEVARGLLLARLGDVQASRRVWHAEPVHALRRRGRERSSWLQELRGLAAGASDDHRRAAVTVERLWSVLEDPGAEPTDRAAAAVALRPRMADAEIPRFLDVARATASERLRVAIERAADTAASDASLVEALAALETTAPPQRGSPF